jgi:lipid II:glycine glycyltransferase (peptidoglycan interpeptide bridge formation enzyme)
MYQSRDASPPSSASTTTYAIISPEPQQWDAFVARHRHGHLLQASPWGALKASVGWHAVRRGVVDTAGQLVAGAQMLVRAAYGLAVSYVPRGPLWSGAAQADEALLKALLGAARRQRAIVLRLEPNLLEGDQQADSFHTWLQLQGLRPVPPLQPQSSIHVDLSRSEADLLAACSKGHRADIRRAERNGVVMREGSGAADLAAFFGMMETTIHSREYYANAQRLLYEATPLGDSCLLLAEHAGATVAAFLVLAWGREAYYLYSGASDAGLKSGANHLLQWYALRWAQARGCALYDMWGVPDQFGQMATAPAREQARLEEAAKADPLYGVYRFKKGFAGEVVRYLPAYDYPLLPWLYGLARRRIDLR